MKTLIFAIASLLFVSCDFSFEENVVEDLSSHYTFFAYKDESSASITKEYEIGAVLSSLPDFQNSSSVNTLKAGYYPDGWNFWKNPDTNNSDYSTAGLLNYSGSFNDNETFTVSSFTVSPANLYFYAAGWTPITYYVRFNANGGSGSMENQEMSYDTSYNLNTNQFTRNGYEFKGWGKSASDTAVFYRDGDSVKNLTQAKDGFVDLYAIWWKTTIRISFDANGGSGSMSEISAKVGETAVPACSFTAPTGHSFSYWTCNLTPYAYYAGDILTESIFPNDDCTFTANWKANPVTLTLDANGGSGGGSETWYYGVSNIISTTPTREGYDFLGWSESASATTATYTNSTSFSITSAKTLYAVWKLQSVTLSYNANGGSGSMPSESLSYTSLPKTLTANAFTRTGYKFIGWGLGSSATAVSLSDGASITADSWNSVYSAGGYLKAIWNARFSLGSATTSTASVSISSLGDTSVTLTTSTVADSFWYIDGAKKSDTSSCTINYADYSAGTHTISLVCITVSSGSATVKQYENTFTIAN